MSVNEKVELRKGLKDVYFDRTKASLIESKPGRLFYRGYSIDDLALYSTFEETSYLLLYGKLPTKDQLDQFDAELRNGRQLPSQVIDTLHLYSSAHPIDAMRGGVSAMGLSDGSPDDMSDEAVLRKGLGSVAKIAIMVAAHHRIRNGDEPIQPNPGLGHAANFLYMLNGAVPDSGDAKVIDKDLILHAYMGVTRRLLRHVWQHRPVRISILQ